MLLFLLLRATIPAAAGPTTGLLSLLLVLTAALPVDLVQSRRRTLLLATLAPRSALASRFTDYLQYLLQVLAPGDVLRGLPLLVPQATIAASLQQDPRQLPTSHGRRDVQRRVAVLRLETIVSRRTSRLLPWAWGFYSCFSRFIGGWFSQIPETRTIDARRYEDDRSTQTFLFRVSWIDFDRGISKWQGADRDLWDKKGIARNLDFGYL